MARVTPSYPMANVGDTIQFSCDGAATWRVESAVKKPVDEMVTIDEHGRATCNGLGAVKIRAIDKYGRDIGFTYLTTPGYLVDGRVLLQTQASIGITAVNKRIHTLVPSEASKNVVMAREADPCSIQCIGAGFGIVSAYDGEGKLLGAVQVLGGVLVINPSGNEASEYYYVLSGRTWLAEPVMEHDLPIDIQSAFDHLRGAPESAQAVGIWVKYADGPLCYCVDLDIARNITRDHGDQAQGKPLPGLTPPDRSMPSPTDQSIVVHASDGNYYSIDGEALPAYKEPAADFNATRLNTHMESLTKAGNVGLYEPPIAAWNTSVIFVNCYLINLRSLQPPR